MATVRTCTTPEDGWALYSHFLGNGLLAIQLQADTRKQENVADCNACQSVIDKAWYRLVGALYVIKWRMSSWGHVQTAIDMAEIINMVVEMDVTDPEVRLLIHEKYTKLNLRR
ncbi:MAG: hypothetical protein Q8Q22_02005 [bacterium]|nr:hypothetical protein [bacterium]